MPSDFDTLCHKLFALRQPPKAPGLPRVQRFLERLGNPQKALTCVQVVGTNGKGSVAVMLAALSKACGYQVGLFTSPHIHSVTERLIVNGQPITEQAFIELYDQLRPSIEECIAAGGPLGFFEIIFAMALVYFKQQECQLVILEAGIGGAEDPGTLAQPLATVLTSVGRDHTDVLGETLYEIAVSKVSGLSENGILISGEREAEVHKYLDELCQVKNARLLQIEEDFNYSIVLETKKGTTLDICLDFTDETYNSITIPFIGVHQARNAAVAVAAMDSVVSSQIAEELGLPEEIVSIQDTIGIEKVYTALKNVHWPGRFEILEEDPFVVLDIAHNPTALTNVKTALDHLKEIVGFERSIMVLGISDGKLVDEMLERIVPGVDVLVLTRAQWRGIEPGELRRRVENHPVRLMREGLAIHIHPTISAALGALRSIVQKTDLILITGSTFVVSEARGILRPEGRQHVRYWF